MQAEFDALRAFNYAQATAHLWVFKKSTTDKKYRAHYVPTDADLTNTLKGLVGSEMGRITEFAPYSYISQVNENSCLIEEHQTTDFALLKAQVDRPEPECRANGLKDLTGADGYLVKLTVDGTTVYAVKRSSSTWRTKYPAKFITMIFTNGELVAAPDSAFSIERNFDFYCMDPYIFIANKRGFESAMQFKAAYSQKFTALQQNPTFSAMFMSMQPLIDYVGTNSMQLRRMARIEDKGLFNQANFLQRLRDVCTQKNWNLNFDQSTGKILACDQTAKHILTLFLDHRLTSELTQNTYDVPDATQV